MLLRRTALDRQCPATTEGPPCFRDIQHWTHNALQNTEGLPCFRDIWHWTHNALQQQRACHVSETYGTGPTMPCNNRGPAMLPRHTALDPQCPATTKGLPCFRGIHCTALNHDALQQQRARHASKTYSTRPTMPYHNRGPAKLLRHTALDPQCPAFRIVTIACEKLERIALD